MDGALKTIKTEVLSWDGVTGHDHRFGGLEFRVGRVELGHVHGDRLADLPFPTKLRNELVESGEVQPHHVLPSSGWVSKWIESEDDVAAVISLFRMNYDRLRARKKTSQPRGPSAV